MKQGSQQSYYHIHNKTDNDCKFILEPKVKLYFSAPSAPSAP